MPRFSTRAQDLTGPVAQLKAAGCTKIFREKITGAPCRSRPHGAASCALTLGAPFGRGVRTTYDRPSPMTRPARTAPWGLCAIALAAYSLLEPVSEWGRNVQDGWKADVPSGAKFQTYAPTAPML